MFKLILLGDEIGKNIRIILLLPFSFFFNFNSMFEFLFQLKREGSQSWLEAAEIQIKIFVLIKPMEYLVFICLETMAFLRKWISNAELWDRTQPLKVNARSTWNNYIFVKAGSAHFNHTILSIISFVGLFF